MRNWVLPIVVLALLAAGGCMSKKSGGTAKKETPGEKPAKVSFVRRQLSEAPDKVREEVQANLVRESSGLIEAEGQVWVFLTRGERRTGGYQVSITDVTLHRNDKGASRLTVTYRYTDPAPGSFATQVLTYPVELVMLQGVEHPPGNVEFIMSR